MRNLLSTQHKRLLELIEYVYQNDGVFIYELCIHFKFSPKTIRNDISFINANFHPIHINVHHTNGISLVFPINYSIEHVYELVLDSSLEFSFLELLFLKKNLTLGTVANKLHSSPSTIRRLISKINNELKISTFSINTSPLKLIGNESDICNFYIHLFSEKYNSRKTPFTLMQSKTLDQLLQTLAKKKYFSWNFPDIEKLRIEIMVNIIRMQHNNEVTSAISLSEKNRADIRSVLTPAIKTLFKITFHIDLTEEVVARLFRSFLVNPFAFDTNTFNTLLETNAVVANTVTLFDKVVTNTANEFNIPLLNKKELLLNLYNINILQYGQPFILYDKCRFFIESIEKNNPEFIIFLKKQYKCVFHHTSMHQYELYSYLYFTIIHWLDLPLFLDKASPTLSVGMFFNTNTNHMLFMKNDIALKFREKLVVTLMDDLSIADFEKSKDSYDIIITNISGIQNNSNSILCFSINPTTTDWEDLYKLYLKIAYCMI